MFGIPHGDHGVNLLDKLLLLVIVKVHVPLGQTRLARSVLNQYEANLSSGKNKGGVSNICNIFPFGDSKMGALIFTIFSGQTRPL